MFRAARRDAPPPFVVAGPPYRLEVELEPGLTTVVLETDAPALLEDVHLDPAS